MAKGIAMFAFLAVACSVAFSADSSTTVAPVKDAMLGKYLIISPRVFRTGSIEIISCTIFKMKADAFVTFRLMKGRSLVLSMTVKVPMSASDRNVKVALQVPDSVQPGNANLQVTSSGSVTFDKAKPIQIERLTTKLLIQTDKPIYKPGSKVQFRIVGVKPDLLPETTNIEEISITNPSGSRMMQWKDVVTKKGLVSMHFKLSARPVLGVWTIKATMKDGNGHAVTESVGITVDKYVLPKYEVKVTTPSYLVEGRPKFMVAVCAKYTYGKPVVGQLSLNVCIKHDAKYRWIRPTPIPCQQFNMKIDGCVDQEVFIKELGSSMRYRYYARLAVTANVTETVTGVTLSKSSNETKIEYTEVRLSFDGSEDSFKPGFPYFMKFSVKGPDGRPLINTPVNITVRTNKGQILKLETVISSGFMEREIDIPAGSTSLSLNAVHTSKLITGRYPRRSHGSKYVKTWYSPSQSFLMIKKPMRTFKVGEFLNVRALSRSKDRYDKGNMFYFNLLCRGNTVLFGKKYVYGSSYYRRISISFRITQKMVPMCRLLLYYVRADGEFVADSADIQMETNFVNKVSVAFKEASKKPGQKVDLVMQASPGSVIGISAVDRSVQLLGKANDISSDEVIDILKSQDVKDSYYYEQRSKCGYGGGPWWGGPRRGKRDIMPYYGGSEQFDGKEALKNAGTVYFTNLKVDVSPCNEPIYPDMPMAMGRPMPESAADGNVRPVMMRKNSNVAGVAGPQPRPAPSTPNKPKPAPSAPVKVRTEFPETWLWSEEVLDKQTGKKVLTVAVPDTMTTWYANAFAISTETGIGVSSPSTIKVMQPFFVSLSLPYSIIRGEKAVILATVFNYMSGSMSVEVQLKGSPDFEFAVLTSSIVCVGGSKAATVKFIVQPKVLGRVPIKVTAVTIAEKLCNVNDTLANDVGVSDAVLRKLLVEPEGIKKELAYSTFFCPDDKLAVPTYTETIPLQLPAAVIPGSVHASISVVGDLMGPTLNGLDSLLKMPYGCGEQNMLNFAPNIYVMKYLKATGQLTSEIEMKAKEFMNVGYQRELTYRRKDGSYAAFGERDSAGGSTWLTAFVLKSYAQARGLIFIDQKDLDVSSRWLLKIQDKDGCFPSLGMVHHKSMKGGVSSGVTMTAFVLNALLETGLPSTNANVQSAIKCIVTGLKSINDSYDAAIIAYTLTLAKSTDKAVVMKFLADHAIREGGLTHWEGIEKKPQKDHSWWYYQAPSADVEMTAYALMAYSSQDLTKSLPIIKWLSKQRNPHGGFSSTQDTCVALQALGDYARLAYGGGMDLNVDVSSTDLSHTFKVTNDNKLVLQKVKVPTVPANILVKATGQGCALLQSTIQYNIPKPADEPSFNISLNPQSIKGSVCQHKLRICSAYIGNGGTNMAIIEVKMVSGFVPVTENLDAILQSTTSSHLNDYEVSDEGVLILYFSEIDDLCIDVVVEQENVVEERKPATVKVYDYYATGNSAVSLYKLDKCSTDTN